MKILYITPTFQHPAMRGPTRCYYFIKELSQRHRITLFALTTGEVAAAAMQEMATYAERIQLFSANGASHSSSAKILNGVPLAGKNLERVLQRRAGIRHMKSAFVRLLRNEAFDVVLFHGKGLYEVIADCNDKPLVVDFCDATSMRYQSKMRYAAPAKRLWYALRYWQIKQIEEKMIAKTPHLAFVSWRDREAVLGTQPIGKVVPIGVDHRYWTRRTHSPRPSCIAFTGVMNYAPNEDAALYLIDRIVPLVKRAIPDLEVLIVGRDPAPLLQQRAQANPEVTVTGFVDDMRAYLERAAVFAAPLRYGSGIQNKILEAMAMEVPVVTTSLAAAGLRIDGAGEAPVLTADDAEKFAAHLIHLLAHPQERARLASAGRSFVENHFVWARSAAQLEEMCLAAAGVKAGL